MSITWIEKQVHIQPPGMTQNPSHQSYIRNSDWCFKVSCTPGYGQGFLRPNGGMVDAIPEGVIGGKHNGCKRAGLTTRKRNSRAGSNPALATKK